jgi:hypothetical protein
MKWAASMNLIGRACGVAALALISFWIAGERIPPRAWASADHRWAAELVAGRVNIHRASVPAFGVWYENTVSYMPEWYARLPGDIPLVGSLRLDLALGQSGRAWLPLVTSWDPGQWLVSVPLWCLAAPLAAAALLAERGYRQRLNLKRTGACLSCGYNREGLAATRPCPECGKAD